MINKLNELDLDIKRCEIVLKENNYLDIVIAIEELHDKYKNTIDSISNISRDVVWNYSKKDIENIQNYLKDYKDELILKEKQKNIYDKFTDLKEYIEDKDILEKQKLVEVINLIENINNDDLNLDEKWDKLKYDKFTDLKEYIEDKDILEKQKLVEVINLIENINNDDLNLDEKWDKLKLYLELIKNQGREIGTQLLEIIVLMAK